MVDHQNTCSSDHVALDVGQSLTGLPGGAEVNSSVGSQRIEAHMVGDISPTTVIPSVSEGSKAQINGPNMEDPRIIREIASKRRQLRVMLIALLESIGIDLTKAQLYESERNSIRTYFANNLARFSKGPDRYVARWKYHCMVLRKWALTDEGLDKAINSYRSLVPRWWHKHVALTTKKAYQLSYSKRALPVAPTWIVDAAANDQKLIMTNACPVTPGLAILTQLAATCKWLGDPQPIFVPSVGSTATSTYRRKDGGKANAFRHLIQNAGFNAMDYFKFDSPMMKDYYESFLRGERAFGFVSDILMSDMRRLTKLLANHDDRSHLSTPVTELGWKVRMVSRSPLPLILESEAYRGPLLWSLNAFGTPFTVPMYEPRFDIKLKRASGPRYVFSSDLKKATDTLSHAAISIVANALRIPVECVAGGTLDGVTIKRGTLMGIPCSWPVLSIIHLTVAYHIDKRKNHLIKGDDLIAYWTTAQIKLYKKLMKSLGFLPHDSIKGKRGTFCERFMEVNNGWLREVRGPFPLRWVHSSEYIHDKFYGAYPMPSSLTMGKTVMTLLNRGASSRILNVQDRITSKVRRNLRCAGIDPYAPVACGGMGLYPRDLDSQMKPLARCVQTHFMNSPQHFVANDLTIHVGHRTLRDHETCRGLESIQALTWVYVPRSQVPGPNLGAIDPRFLDLYRSRLSVKNVLLIEDGPSRPPKFWQVIRQCNRACRHAKRLGVPPLPWTYRESMDFPSRIYPDRMQSLIWRHCPGLFPDINGRLVPQAMLPETMIAAVEQLQHKGVSLDIMPLPFGRGFAAPDFFVGGDSDV